MIQNQLDAAVTAWDLLRSSDDLKKSAALLGEDEVAMMEKAMLNIRIALEKRAKEAA